MDAPADQPEVEANASEHLVAEVGAQTQQGGDDDSSDSSARRDAERRERYRHCGLEEASDPETWMEVHHFNVRGEDHQFVHSWR